MNQHDITEHADSLEIEQAVALELDGERIALCRTETGVFAVADTCTHAQASLAEGFLMENWIECPLHQARYDLASGELLDGPACPALRTFPLHQRGDRLIIEIQPAD